MYKTPLPKLTPQLGDIAPSIQMPSVSVYCKTIRLKFQNEPECYFGNAVLKP